MNRRDVLVLIVPDMLYLHACPRVFFIFLLWGDNHPVSFLNSKVVTLCWSRISRFKSPLEMGLSPWIYWTGLAMKWDHSLLKTGLVPYWTKSDPVQIRYYPVPVPFYLYWVALCIKGIVLVTTGCNSVNSRFLNCLIGPTLPRRHFVSFLDCTLKGHNKFYYCTLKGHTQVSLIVLGKYCIVYWSIECKIVVYFLK